MPNDEVLLVGNADQIASLDRWPVAAQVDPDVVVLRAGPAQLDEIAQHGRLAMARRPDGSTELVGDERVLDELDEGARLFVAAWRARPLAKSHRPGEGLPWDADGFEAPGSHGS